MGPGANPYVEAVQELGGVTSVAMQMSLLYQRQQAHAVCRDCQDF